MGAIGRTIPDIALRNNPADVAREIRRSAERDKMMDSPEWECTCTCGAEVHFFVRIVFCEQIMHHTLCGIDHLEKYLMGFGTFDRDNCILELIPSRPLTDAESKRVDNAFALIPWLDEEQERLLVQALNIHDNK